MEGNLEKTLGKECEVAKVMRFLKEINVYEDINTGKRIGPYSQLFIFYPRPKSTLPNLIIKKI